MSQLPNDRQRLAVIGATGSGKTQAGLWHLSLRSYDRKPWIIYDFKRDEMIMEIGEMAQYIDYGSDIPDRPGVYILPASPDEEQQISDHMKKIWEHENVGVYIDEGYMVGNNNNGLRLLLTQGRSKRIPMITLSQRPVWMDRFVFSESEYFQVFRLQFAGDIKKVEEYIPGYSEVLEEYPLEEFQSYYYQAPKNRLLRLDPVPDREAILDTFHLKLRRLKKVV